METKIIVLDFIEIIHVILNKYLRNYSLYVFLFYYKIISIYIPSFYCPKLLNAALCNLYKFD